MNGSNPPNPDNSSWMVSVVPAHHQISSEWLIAKHNRTDDKKLRRGSEMSKHDMELIVRRLKWAEEESTCLTHVCSQAWQSEAWGTLPARLRR
jgi:hypothetical protein